MELTGLKINILGDSITQGVGASSPEKCYVSCLAELSGALCRNYGISGTRIARKRVPTENSIFDQDFVSRVDGMDQDADIVLVFGGTNDFGHGDAPLGQLGDSTVWSFYGALSVLYNSLRLRFPNSRIVILTPIKRRIEENRNGLLSDFVTAELKVAGEYGFPVLDWYHNLSVDLHDPEMEAIYSADGLHPNDAGHKLLAETVFAYLEKL